MLKIICFYVGFQEKRAMSKTCVGHRILGMHFVVTGFLETTPREFVNPLYILLYECMGPQADTLHPELSSGPLRALHGLMETYLCQQVLAVT